MLRRVLKPGMCMLAASLILAARASAQTPLGSEITYQGQLNLSGTPVTGTADFQFALWDADTAGSQIGSTLAANNVTVVDGVFTLDLDFGAMAFNGDARWLEISVASPTGGTFEVLSPRQPLAATPYSLQTRGLMVDDAGNVGIGTTAPGEMLDVAGTVRATIHNATTHYALGGNPVLTAGAANTAVGSTAGHGTGAGNTIMGKNAGASLEVVSNSNCFFGEKAGRFTNGGGNSFLGASVGLNNTTGNNNSFFGATAGASNTTGRDNTAIGFGADMASGNLHNATAIGANAVVARSNAIVLGNNAAVGIGTSSPSAALDIVGTSEFNGTVAIDGTGSPSAALDVVGTSEFNGSVAIDGAVSIGTSTPHGRLHVEGSTGGALQILNWSAGPTQVVGQWSSAASGAQVRFTGADPETFIDLGEDATGSFVVETNDVPRLTVTGSGNVGIGTSAPHAPLSFPNTLGNKISLWGNHPDGHFGIGIQSGVLQLYSHHPNSGIALGYGNSDNFRERMRIYHGGMRLGDSVTRQQDINFLSADGDWHLGSNNAGNGTDGNQFYIWDESASAYQFTVQKDTGNVGIGTTAPSNPLTVTGDADFTGRVGIGTDSPEAELHVEGNTLVKGSIDVAPASGTSRLILRAPDSNTAALLTFENSSGARLGGLMRQAPADDIFLFNRNAQGITIVGETNNVGIGITEPAHPLHVGTDTTNGNGAHVTTGGTWTNGSSRTWKTNFRDLDGQELLQRVAALPIKRWNYTGSDEGDHIGPTAEDFHAAFGLGADQRYITTVDADGVALAAIQELHAESQAKDKKIADLHARLKRMETLLATFTNTESARR